MKMYPKSGKYTTGYYILIGSKEAREAGFLDENGERLELKKTVDKEHNRIIIELDKGAE